VLLAAFGCNATKSLNLISRLAAKAASLLFSNKTRASSEAILVKFEKYKIIIDKLGNRFLNLLLVINVIFIIAYILILLYVNIKLSSNLDDFIDVAYANNDMKKGIILFINKKFLFCLDNKHRNKCSYNLFNNFLAYASLALLAFA
jgi:hypothetical protein